MVQVDITETNKYRKLRLKLCGYFMILIVCVVAVVLDENAIAHAEDFTINTMEVVGSEDDLKYDENYLQRQRIDLRLNAAGPLETMLISTAIGLSDGMIAMDGQWLSTGDSDARVSNMMGLPLRINYQGESVFSTEDIAYDFVNFITVCSAPDRSHRLLFRLNSGGSANGNIQDLLFFYKDHENNTFQYKIIERRYLPSKCDMESAKSNQLAQELQLSELNLIHGRLRPSVDETDVSTHLESNVQLSVKTFSIEQLDSILDDFRSYRSVEDEEKPDALSKKQQYEEAYVDYYAPRFLIENIAENENWIIKEVLYLQLYTSWGILLAQNKNTQQWTSFYTVSGGDSKQHLYFDDDVELVGDELRGVYSAYGSQRVAISLTNFSVQYTHPYAFSDYPIETVYAGPIAKLDLSSSELAQSFPTKIQQALDGGVNFAGHYAVVSAGCEADCQMLAITDVKTGAVVVELPSLTASEYNSDSALFILNADAATAKPSYYQMIGGKFTELNAE